MADASTTGCSPSTSPPSSSRLTKSALTAHDKALAAVASSSANPTNRPYTPAAGLTSRRYSTPGHRMKMTIPISPPPSVSGKSHLPSSASPQSPGGPGYTMPMTPSASTVSGQSRRASLTSSQSVAHAFGYTTATTTPARYFPLPSPVDPSVRTAPTSSALPKAPTPNLDTIQEVSSSGSRTNSRSGSTVAKGGGPPTPTGSVKSNHSRAGSLSNRSTPSSLAGTNNHRTSTSKASYFHWEPGAAPVAIYDPDYPTGSPECLSPRRMSSVTTTSSSADETQARDYFSQPIRRHHHEDRSSPRPRRPQRQVSTPAKTVVSSSPPLKDKDALPPTPGDVVSITPSPPTSTKCDTPHSEVLGPPLSLSEFSHSNQMGRLDNVFGLVTSDDTGRHPLGAIPWNEMPQFIRRHNREVERRERERDKVVAKDQAVREIKRREKMTVTEARLVAGEWKMMDEIPPTLELIQRAGREEEKRMLVRIDGTVELTGIGFLRDLPLEKQRRLLNERSELDKWLKGEIKEKPRHLVEELAAYEKRLKEGEGNETVRSLADGRKVALIEAPPPTVVVTAAQTEPGKLASVVEVDEPANNPEDFRRPASPAGT